MHEEENHPLHAGRKVRRFRRKRMPHLLGRRGRSHQKIRERKRTESDGTPAQRLATAHPAWGSGEHAHGFSRYWGKSGEKEVSFVAPGGTSYASPAFAPCILY